MELGKKSKCLLSVYNLGYRCDKDGNVFNQKGKMRKLWVDKKGDGYYNFSIRISDQSLDMCKKMVNIHVHRLQAYQKFGDKMFDNGIHVRHLNGNSKDNSWNNIEIGTNSDNMLDRPKELRIQSAINASTKIRKFSDDEMEEIRNFYKHNKSYTKTQKQFNISSKGTLHRILNVTYKTIKTPP